MMIQKNLKFGGGGGWVIEFVRFQKKGWVKAMTFLREGGKKKSGGAENRFSRGRYNKKIRWRGNNGGEKKRKGVH